MIIELEKFAKKHGIFLVRKGEVGFGRPCVGFISSDESAYVDYNACVYPDFNPAFPNDDQYSPPREVEDAYHKHDCLAVLVYGDDYNKALHQLLIWVRDIENRNGYVVKYRNYATGFKQLLVGDYGITFRFLN